jgi:type I restriction enzyme S subunit
MKRYEKYKPSGIEWIGEVPEHWNQFRIKYALSRSAAGVWGDDEKGDDNDIICYRIADFDYDHGGLNLDDLTTRNIEPKQLEGRIVKEGDLLIEKSGGGEATPVGRVVKVNSDQRATYTNFIHSVSIKEGYDSNYLYYYFNTLYALKINMLFFNQTTGLQNLKVGDYLSQTMYLPLLSEQEAIAAYLDARCGDIDKVVATQEKRIALLNEMKQSIITQAVTRGLNPDAKMKDSGVEWIGMVPEHWDVMPFKSKFKTDKGLSITKADLVDEGVPVISYGQIHSKQNDYVHTLDHLLRFIPEELIPADSKAKLEIGDIVFADTSEDVEGSGNAFYIEREGVYAGYHTVIAKSIEHVDNKYFAYLFATPIWRSQVRSQVYGVKVYSITQQILKATSLIVPSPEEQKQIVEVLEEKCARIDRQIDNIQNEIELLREYKQSLITDVVTGKMKVC